MNSVHLVTRQKYRVEPGQKLSQVHQNTQPGPAAHTRRAQAAQPAAPRAPTCSCRAPPRVHAVSARLLRAPRSCCRAPRACCRSPSLSRAPPAARLPVRLRLSPACARSPSTRARLAPCAPACSLLARPHAQRSRLRPSAHTCAPAT